MEVEAVTAPGNALLGAVRGALDDADEALLCVAFAQARGVHLVAKELAGVAARGNARALVTTVFDRSGHAGLAALAEAGATVRVLNPAGATYHPKVYLARRARQLTAIVGSVNLTSGLFGNVEAATVLRGSVADAPLAALWSWAHSLWIDPRSIAWLPGPSEPDEAIEPELLALIAAAAAEQPVIYTLGSTPQPNRVSDVNASGVWVETNRSRERGQGSQMVPPRMLNLAWDALRARGRLTNREMLDELRIHRSSFVCAMLARLPGVRVVKSRPIELEWVGPAR